VLAFGIWSRMPPRVIPAGALGRLAQAARRVETAADLAPLAPLARAAVSEELARPVPSHLQVADLLMVAYIAERPREDRQVADLRFLVDQVRVRRPETAPEKVSAGPAGFGPRWGWVRPLLATAAAGLPEAAVAEGEGTGAALEAARRGILRGDYEGALAHLAPAAETAVLRAWCLSVLGRKAEAAVALEGIDRTAEGPLARLVRADLALAAGGVGEAVKEYETLADQHDRYWFAAGYLYRYELRDLRSAGACFRRVAEAPLADYVRKAFARELALAETPGPEPLVAVDFEDYQPGAMPKHWTLVRVRDGEFRVVEVPAGRALSQGPGTEFVTGQNDWADYTVQVDVKVLPGSAGQFGVAAAAYRGADGSGYVLELTADRLRILKQMPGRGRADPVVGQVHRLVLPPAEGWWYTLKLRVQRVETGVNVAGKVWRTDTPEPIGWHVAWTDTGQPEAGPLEGGRAGVQVRGARVLVDNLLITRNASSEELVATAKP